MQKFDVIIVGAGASGMMAAIVSAQKGKKILLLEKMEQPGRKLRITGKGRCNITNAKPLETFLNRINTNSNFLHHAFSVFFTKELIDFFEKRSVPLVVERGDRVFPKSNKAQDIFFALIKQIEKLPVTILRNAAVDHILVQDKKTVGVELKDETRFFSSKIILATGGKSYPLTGSTGDGFRMAKELGHKIILPVPALVPLVCKELIPFEAQNFPLKNIRLNVYQNQKLISEEFGEMSFIKNGIAGPLVLTVSRKISRQLQQGKEFTCCIDFKPALSNEKLEKKLEREINENKHRTFKEVLRLWLPSKLQKLALQNIAISEFKKVSEFTSDDLMKIQQFLKHFSLTIIATKSFDEAVITQGGVSVDEINPLTMESILVKGLFFSGEIIDLDADTGGYNLQIAFSTAYIAAQ